MNEAVLKVGQQPAYKFSGERARFVFDAYRTIEGRLAYKTMNVRTRV